MRIKQLPPLIANQIAAGEVVERPASVVKELLENSFDAKADAITIEIGYGGLNQIKVSDNGMGIMAEDLPLAVAAHATSKINTLNDLYAVGSMGFRGEALASVAAVAKVTISSKPMQQETAMMLYAQDAEISLSPCARSVGTTVDVVDLFFNAPVRKRFLKSEKLEFQAIEAIIKRFALSAPHITLILKHNGKQILSLPAATSEQAQIKRMTRILGTAFVKDAIYLDVAHGGMKLYGWISGVNFQRSQNDRSWIYINQRMVKDKLILYALKQAYEGLLYPGRFPACALYFSINHDEVDVNVHPTKHEVRFQQPRLVFDFFTSQLAAALKSEATCNKKTTYSLGVEENIIKTQEIYEPYPHLSEKRLGGSTHHHNEVSWVILNNRFVLVFLNEKPYIVDYVALQQYAVRLQLVQRALPLAGRPLLVPIRYSVQHDLACSSIELSHYLNQLGIHVQWVGTSELVIGSIPLCTPYLDLRLFLDEVCGLKSFHQHQLVELIAQSQVVDPKLVSVEEKIYFNELLLQMDDTEKRNVFRPLTIEVCQDLFHV